jgi:hypothetical protein
MSDPLARAVYAMSNSVWAPPGMSAAALRGMLVAALKEMREPTDVGSSLSPQDHSPHAGHDLAS